MSASINELVKDKEVLSVTPGVLIIFTGPTAVGKTEIRERMTKKYSKIKSLITTTSRKMREREVQGADYHFTTPEGFMEQVQRGDFLEYAEYGGNLYGTTKAELNRVLSGENLMSTMEISGAANFKPRVQEAYGKEEAKAILEKTVIIFVEADEDTLRQRYKKRRAGLGNFETRFLQDKNMERDFGHLFKVRVHNAHNQIEATIGAVEKLIETTFSIPIASFC